MNPPFSFSFFWPHNLFSISLSIYCSLNFSTTPYYTHSTLNSLYQDQFQTPQGSSSSSSAISKLKCSFQTFNNSDSKPIFKIKMECSFQTPISVDLESKPPPLRAGKSRVEDDGVDGRSGAASRGRFSASRRRRRR